MAAFKKLRKARRWPNWNRQGSLAHGAGDSIASAASGTDALDGRLNQVLSQTAHGGQKPSGLGPASFQVAMIGHFGERKGVYGDQSAYCRLICVR